MVDLSKIIMGVLPSLGGSIKSQQIDRREGLFLNYYIPTYLSKFNKIYYFSYAIEKKIFRQDLVVCSNQFNIHRYLYALLLPFIYGRAIRECHLIRVMHLNGAISAILAKKLYGIPFVTTYGYNYAKFAEIEGHHLKAKLIRRCIPYLLRQADGIIVTTEELKGEVEAWIGESEKINLVPNGVDTKRFAPVQNFNQKRQSSPFFRMLFIGRLEKQKNLFFLLDVVSKLKSKIPVKLTLIGRGSLEDSLKEKARREDLPVEFIDRVPYEAIPDYHRQADCFISTSLAEGHPKALIEAMSSALPCVVSSCAGNVGLVDSERTGIILKENSVDAWVDSLLNLIGDPEKQVRLSENAREWVVRNFDLRNTLAKELNLLASLQRNASEK